MLLSSLNIVLSVAAGNAETKAYDHTSGGSVNHTGYDSIDIGPQLRALAPSSALVFGLQVRYHCEASALSIICMY